MTSNKILRADDTECDPRVDREACRRTGLRSMIVMPLRYDERSFGVMKLMSAHAGAFTASADQTLHLMQEFLGVTIARQRTQAALQESEGQFRTLVNAIPQLARMANADGWLTWYNQRWYQYTGTTPEQMEGWGWQSVHDPETLPAVLERWKECIATGEPFDMIFPLRGADGVFRRFLTRGWPLKNSEGRVVRWFGTNTDVDELKRAEDALLESNARLEKVLEVETVGVIFWDLTTGCMTGANDTFLKLMGYSRHDVEAGQLTWQKLTPPEYVEASLAELRKFAANGRVGPYEKEYFRKDGTRQWLIFAGSSLGGNACVEFCVDVSARKNAEKALRESEERLRLAQQAGRVGVFDWDLVTGRVVWAPELEEIFGLERGRFENRYEGWSKRVHPDDLPRIEALFAEWLQSDRDEEQWDYRYRRQGEVRWISARGRVIRDSAGKPLRMIGTNLDMTERKKREEQVHLLLREVNHRAKNMLGVVQAIASQTAASTKREDFVVRFSARLQALAANQNLLVKNQWQGVELADLVRAQLAHFEGLIGSRIEIGGPPLHIAAEAAQPLAMALHELATNAGKYGALSNGKGEVKIEWENNRDGTFRLSWTESGGPPVSRPGRRGFGTTVIADVPELQLGAEVTLDYPPDGVRWRLACGGQNGFESRDASSRVSA